MRVKSSERLLLAVAIGLALAGCGGAPRTSGSGAPAAPATPRGGWCMR